MVEGWLSGFSTHHWPPLTVHTCGPNIYASKTPVHKKLKKLKLINWNSPNSKMSDIAKTLLIKCRNLTGRKSGHGNFGI